MKRIPLMALMASIFLSCDPVSILDANIENSTSQNLSIIFVSSDTSLNKTLQIAPKKTVLFQEGMDIGGSLLEPSLVEYDSVYIRNGSNELLKIYKQNSPGKNIYKVEEYWTSSEPSNRYYKYDYKIEKEDIE